MTVHVRAVVERLGTSQAGTLVVGREGGEPQAGAERRWETLPSEQGSYWAQVGRDREVEERLLRRIRDRIDETSPDTVPEASPARATRAESLRQEAKEHGTTAEDIRREAEKYGR